jgi:predicted RNA binding protein YcfA (HicA-like mRNA interferase family)
MEGFPKHLGWREFCLVLKQLGYEPSKHKKRGAARDFLHPTRDPQVVTFHEPHGKDTIPRGTLGLYLSKLRLTKEEFLELLKFC